MKKNNSIKINVRNALALVNIIDDYQAFDKALINLLNEEKNRMDVIWNLGALSRGERCVCSKKTKKFYKENKRIIDEIIKYINLQAFIFNNYAWHLDEPEIEHKNLEFLKYLEANKSEINIILLNLEKIDRLRFRDMELDTELDFSKQTYEMDLKKENNSQIIYLDNLEPVVNYNCGDMAYRTSFSNYKITLPIVCGCINREAMGISVNSLTFDSALLPDALSYEPIFYRIINLQNQRLSEYNAVRNSVDLSVGARDIELLLLQYNSTISRMTDVSDKEELIKLLVEMNDTLSKIKELINNYNQQITKNSSVITMNLLENEKYKYMVKRLNWKNHIS